MTNHPRRTFLGWDEPPLALAARWLRKEFGEDLGQVVIALPGARAGRALRERLSRESNAAWNPPRIVTHGRLSDELVHLSRPVAGRLVRTLAWARALDSLPPKDRGRIALRVERDPSFTGRMRVSETLRQLHGLMAPEGLGFDVLAEGPHAPQDNPGEVARWRALAAAQTAYRDILAESGHADPHEARREAIADGHVDTEVRVVLIGVVDVGHLLLELLKRVADRTDVLVVAPEARAAGFDEWGRLQTDYWLEENVPLSLDHWHVVPKPVDQAQKAEEILAGWDGAYAAEEVTLGIADDQVAPYIERRLVTSGVHVRNAAGTSWSRSRPAKLLEGVARFLRHRGFAELTGLLRHPDVESLVRRRLEGVHHPILACDRYFEEHLPLMATGAAGEWVEDSRWTEEMRSIQGAVFDLLEELLEDRPDHPEGLAVWGRRLRRFVGRVFGTMQLDPTTERDRLLAGALIVLRDALDEWEEIPAWAEVRVSGAEAVELFLRVQGAPAIPPAPILEPGTVELLGWLELPFDDAPALIVTGFNEGRVPQSIQGDPFLPDGVRRRLGIAHNDDRLARDAYAMHVLSNTRTDLAFVTGRATLDGDPLVPSRLAFQASDADVVARVQHFLPEEEAGPEPSGMQDEDQAEQELPRLPETPAIEAMSVSSFRTWIDSPYTFYMERVLKLRSVDDREREMSPLRFGSFAHEVVQAFGESQTRDSVDAEEIGAFLEAELERKVKSQFGLRPEPAVFLQVEQLRYRLQHFAAAQARWAADGWRIRHVEWAPENGQVDLEVDGKPMGIRGKIDRIDQHPTRGWAVLDYKTGDRVSSPDRAHRRRDGSWKDLQLPLYSYLTRFLDDVEGTPLVGYIHLGKDAGSVYFDVAEKWDASVLEEGVEAAREVVREVREADFFRVGRLPWGDILQAICGEGLMQAGASNG